MERQFESRYHAAEQDDWWFCARRDMILKLLSNTRKDAKILDIGCSGGALLQELREKDFTNVHGIDKSSAAIDMCRKRGIGNVSLMDGSEPRFDDAVFDVVISSDVLEHIRDDGKALEQWARLLKPSGRLILFVPAFQFLWSYHDEVNRHFRRYSRKELVSRLEGSGLMISRISFWNLSMLVPALFIKLLNRKEGHLHELPWLLNTILKLVMKLENALLGLINLPLGVSLFAVCRKAQ